MKVYIRRWRNGERNYVMEGPYVIDAYNGLTFQTMEGGNGATTLVLGNTKVRTVFLHAGEKDALVMYVEDATPKGGGDECRREDAAEAE